MCDLIDISVSLSDRLPSWPGSFGMRLERRSDVAAGDPATSSVLTLDLHLGTHIDAPLHFLSEGNAVDRLPLEPMIGPAWVANVLSTGAIGPAELEALSIPAGTTRLILKTENSALWAQDRPFYPDFVALSAEGAGWVVAHGIQLLGIDYLSIQRFRDPPATHIVLLSAGIIVVEGLCLAGVAPGAYELICLPLRLANAEAAPARVLLRKPAPAPRVQ